MRGAAREGGSYRDIFGFRACPEATTNMRSSTKILVGLLAGVFVDLFLGEHASVFKIAADGFVKLLQMTVLPYITLSIITSLAALGYDQVNTLGLRAGPVLIGLWCLALAFTFLFPLAFPDVETASFFSTTLVEQRQPFNFVDLFIPSNPFYALSNNVVPAVVLFSVFVGVALIGVDRKQPALEVFGVARSRLGSFHQYPDRIEAARRHHQCAVQPLGFWASRRGGANRAGRLCATYWWIDKGSVPVY